MKPKPSTSRFTNATRPRYPLHHLNLNSSSRRQSNKKKEEDRLHLSVRFRVSNPSPTYSKTNTPKPTLLGCHSNSNSNSKDKTNNVTPSHPKIPTPAAQDEDATTPPALPSISPELHSITHSLSTTTPCCYAAGHMLSGVSDKRKCRPKGLLAVNAPSDFKLKDSIPSPLQASMLWLSSPSNHTTSDSPHCTSHSSPQNELKSQPIRDGDDQRHSIALSFQVESPATSCSTSIFLSQVHHPMPDDHQASWNSCSTLSFGNESEMRISWREGLMDQIDELQELDSCRCLSDDEQDTNACSYDVFQLCQALDINAAITDDDWVSSAKIEGKDEEKYVSRPSPSLCSCAESMSIDGEGLLASAESDSALCYKD